MRLNLWKTITVRSCLQEDIYEMKDSWQRSKVNEMEALNISNDLWGQDNTLNDDYGPQTNRFAPAERAAGAKVLTDEQAIINPWGQSPLQSY